MVKTLETWSEKNEVFILLAETPKFDHVDGQNAWSKKIYFRKLQRKCKVTNICKVREGRIQDMTEPQGREVRIALILSSGLWSSLKK